MKQIFIQLAAQRLALYSSLNKIDGVEKYVFEDGKRKEGKLVNHNILEIIFIEY